MKQPAYHTNLPPQVRFDRKLSANAKLLYGEVKALCDQQGYCWASNYYFASLYGVHKETVSLWLRQLKAGQWIRIELLSDQGNLRKIYLNESRSEVHSTPSSSQRKSQGVGVKDQRGLTDSSPPSYDLVVPKPPALLIENIIDNNDRIHSPPLKDLSGSDELEKTECRTEQIAEETVGANPPVAPHPPLRTRLPPKKEVVVPFAKPLIKEVESYMLGQKEFCPSALTARAQALRFVNYYESNGWKVGRNAMQDWRAAANNWLLNAQDYADKATRKSHNGISSPDFDPYAPRLHSGGSAAGRPKDYSIPL